MDTRYFFAFPLAQGTEKITDIQCAIQDKVPGASLAWREKEYKLHLTLLFPNQSSAAFFPILEETLPEVYMDFRSRGFFTDDGIKLSMGEPGAFGDNCNAGKGSAILRIVDEDEKQALKKFRAEWIEKSLSKAAKKKMTKDNGEPWTFKDVDEDHHREWTPHVLIFSSTRTARFPLQTLKDKNLSFSNITVLLDSVALYKSERIRVKEFYHLADNSRVFSLSKGVFI